MDFGIVGESDAVIDVALHRMEKRFDEGVVGHLAGAVHALNETELGKTVLECCGGIFGTPISVKDQPAPWPAAVHGAVQGAQGQRDVLLRPEAPTDDPSAVLVHHHGEVAVDRSDLQVRDVANPDLVGALELEIELLVQDATKEAL